MKPCKNIFLFVVGGITYYTIEVLWRFMCGSNPTHWSMFIIGGLCFFLIGAINENISWDMPLLFQVVIGTIIILTLEFFSGCILNLWLHLNIWDYSNQPLNILGQVCLPFAFAWAGLALFAIVLDDYLRYWFFGEERPHYRLK